MGEEILWEKRGHVHMGEAMAQCRLFDIVNRQESAKDIQEGAKAFAEKRKPAYKGC